jgi:D-mannonate dehydratase
MDIAALTTLGGVVTSVASSMAAALAWGTKLQFSEEFKEARNAQVTVANQVVESIKVQRDAEIQQIKIEVEKKNVEIERLQAKIEDLERNTIGAFKAKFDDVRATYESMIASLTSPSGNGLNALNNKDLIENKEIFELTLNDLGESLNHFAHRREARSWLTKNHKILTDKAFDYVLTRRSDTLIYCEGNEKERKLNQFYFDIEDYLELIGDCLIGLFRLKYA